VLVEAQVRHLGAKREFLAVRPSTSLADAETRVCNRATERFLAEQGDHYVGVVLKI
jgi:hypothetical protein